MLHKPILGFLEICHLPIFREICYNIICKTIVKQAPMALIKEEFQNGKLIAQTHL